MDKKINLFMEKLTGVSVVLQAKSTRIYPCFCME
jgi:hypothetical protein